MNQAEQAAFTAMQEALEDLKRQYQEHPDAFWDWTKARAAIIAAKAVQPQAQKESVTFLADGIRFKVRRSPLYQDGRIYGLPSELNGRWVALVASDDDCHLKLTANPQATEPQLKEQT